MSANTNNMIAYPSATGVNAYIPKIVSTLYPLPVSAETLPKSHKTTNVQGISPGPYDPFANGTSQAPEYLDDQIETEGGLLIVTSNNDPILADVA